MSSKSLIIIGGGPGGYAAALDAASRKLRVTLIDQQDIGGACLNRGCIPSKFFLSKSKRLADALHLGDAGIQVRVRLGGSSQLPDPTYEAAFGEGLVLCFISLLVLKETERYLAKINCSPEQAIELLGKAGEGKVRIGNIELKTESELETTTQLIHNLFKGH